MMLSILTMTEYNPTIWNDFAVPSILDPDDVKNKIIMDCAELELLYTEPALLKYMIKMWVQTESHIWQKLADTMNLQYNPIYNLDVTWEETRTPDLTKTHNTQETGSKNINSNNVNTPNITELRNPDITHTETPTDTTTESVAGFNSATFENARQTTRGGSITDHETGTEMRGRFGTDKTDYKEEETNSNNAETTEHETGSETITIRRYGNQGVTMTQDMIQKEREISEFNLYEYITKSFKNRFCLLVY